MSWSLDHVAITGHDVSRSVAFFTEVFGMVEQSSGFVPHPAMPKNVWGHMYDDLGSSLHVSGAIPNFHCKYPTLGLNVTGPHFAVTVDDVGEVQKRLEAIGWEYCRPTEWGPAGLTRLWTQDPFLNVVEANQSMKTRNLPSLANEAEPSNRPDWRLYDVCSTSFDLAVSAEWWSVFLGVEPETDSDAVHQISDEYSIERGAVLCFRDSNGRRIKLVNPSSNPGRNFRDWAIDPILRGSVGIAVRGFDKVKERLDALSVPNAQHANGGSLCLLDPSVNVVEAVEAQDAILV